MANEFRARAPVHSAVVRDACSLVRAKLTLHHFIVGGAIDGDRLATLPAYDHLSPSELRRVGPGFNQSVAR